MGKYFRVVLIGLFSFLILNYPGDFFYFKLYSDNYSHWLEEEKKIDYSVKSFPFVSNSTIQPEITAQGVYFVDLDSFTPFFEKNSNQKFLPASTTKLITALVAIDHFRLDQNLKVKKIVDEPQIMGLISGEEISFENLLYGILIHSANDAAFVIADNFPGGEENFVRKMNEKAKQLMMKNSYFKNPAGFDDFGQFTTPFELSLAARAVLNNQTLKKIVAIKNITVADKDFKIFHSLQNVNRLLGEVSGLGGLKTGYTENAGENLISYYKKNGRQLILVVLKSEDRFEDTKKLIDWFNKNVAYYSI